MKALLIVTALAVIGTQPAMAVDQGHEFDWDPVTLTGNNWICVSPEAYNEAVELEKNTPRAELDHLKDQLLEQKSCMFVNDDDAEDIMAPFVKVLERNGDKARVQFTIEYYNRIALLHRDIRRVTYAGWTSEKDLTSAFPLYSN
jgi:hypothetical protein